jgi:menaquinone-dependent protoporphyrinogen oxidase
MSLFLVLESWTEGLLRVAIGTGLTWIGAAEGDGYGLFLVVVGMIFVGAGIGEIWSVEAAVRRQRRETTMTTQPASIVTCDIPVFYATSEGQTRRIAERLVAIFRDRGFSSRAIDVASAEARNVEWRRVQAALVGASLHGHRHQRTARAFVDELEPELNVLPSVFFSVSLAAASEDATERADAARLARDFVETAEWDATEVVCLAGRLAYTKYGWLTRFMMSRIARRRGQPADTSRDYEFTNWDEVSRLAGRVIAHIGAELAARKAAA